MFQNSSPDIRVIPQSDGSVKYVGDNGQEYTSIEVNGIIQKNHERNQTISYFATGFSLIILFLVLYIVIKREIYRKVNFLKLIATYSNTILILYALNICMNEKCFALPIIFTICALYNSYFIIKLPKNSEYLSWFFYSICIFLVFLGLWIRGEYQLYDEGIIVCVISVINFVYVITQKQN